MKTRTLLSLALASFLVGCGGGGGGSSSSGSNTDIDVKEDILISNIFPQNPKVPLSSSLKLTPVVIDKYTSNIKTQSLNENIVVTFSSLNEDIVTVNDSGVIYARALGSAVIEAVATKIEDNVTYEDKIQVPVKVVNTFGDIAKISLNPTRATIDITGGSKTFDVSAINNNQEPASLAQGTLDFNISNPQGNAEKIITQPASITDGSNSVVIQSANDRVGYVFITPVYKDKYDGNITATGNPLVVQVNSTPKATSDNADSSAIDAGAYLDLKVNEQNGAKELHVVHYDRVGKNLKYSLFNGSWKNENIKSATTATNSGEGAKIALSPFENNYKKPIIVALEDKNIELWYQNNSNNWINQRVSLNDVVDSNLSLDYSKSKNFLDVAVDESNKLLYVTYFSPIEERIYLVKSTMTNTQTLDFSNNFVSIDTDNIVQSLSLTLNSNNLPRIAYSTLKDVNKTDNVNGVFYASVNNSNVVSVEKLVGTTGDERGVVLKLDNANRPAIIYYTDANRLFYHERAKEPSGYTWPSSDIKSGSKDSFTAISGLDFTFDYYNSPRVTFNSNSEIKYARRLSDNNNEWIVETPESGSTFGEYKAIELDSENRVHIVYTSESDKWFKYWAEPIFFDYRRYNLDAVVDGIDEVN